MARVPARLASFPGNVLEIIRAQCSGDWSRVTTDGNSFTVHNHPQQFERIMKAPPRPRQEVKQRAEPPPAVIIKRYDDEPPTVKVSLKAEPEIKLPVNQVVVVKGDPTSDDFDGDVDLLASDLARRLANGLGERLPLKFFTGVLETSGLNLEEAERIVRYGKHVEARPESILKGYPILKFAGSVKSDIEVIVGFRNMHEPSVLRVDQHMRLVHDEHHVNVRGGGGKKKNSSGVPTSPEKIALGLRNLGAEVPEFDPMSQSAVNVVYRGRSIGKLSPKPITKQEGTITWNRLYRALNGARAQVKV